MVDALMPCISTEETRYYLCGIHIENDSRAGMMAVATNGHHMGTLRINPMQDDSKTPDLSVPEFNFILPMEAVKWIDKLPRKFNYDPLLRFESDGVKVKLSAIPLGMVFECKLIDGSFPDWRRVMPTEYSVSASFNAGYMKDIASAIKKAGSKRMSLLEISIVDSRGPAVITTNDTALHYVILPMGSDDAIKHTNAYVPSPAPETATA